MSREKCLLKLSGGHALRMPKQADKANRNSTAKFALLLTTFNEPKRTDMYAKRLEWWLRETGLPIYVVDSANFSFPPGLEQIRDFRVLHFNQSQVTGGTVPRGGKTGYELLSLKMAYQAFKDEWAQYDYVLKVTGKYVLPDLEAYMSAVNPNTDFVIQTIPWDGIGTECIGFNSQRMMDLLLEIESMEAQDLEKRVELTLNGRPERRVTLPLMRIPEEYRTPREYGDTLTAVLSQLDGVKNRSGTRVALEADDSHILNRDPGHKILKTLRLSDDDETRGSRADNH